MTKLELLELLNLHNVYAKLEKKSVGAFQVNRGSFFCGLILVIPAIFSNISRKIKLNTFSFHLKDLLLYQNILNVH